MISFLEKYNTYKNQIDGFLENTIYPEFQSTYHPVLAEACIYSLRAGGKRLRPILSLVAGGTTESNKGIFWIASALECLHTYSLIHDDLPAMDNDDFRRGILTNHKKFGEAEAILAGDALNSFAFFAISRSGNSESDFSYYHDIYRYLHEGGGGPGMVSGQMLDMKSGGANQTSNPECLEKIHSAKTGALIQASLLLGNRARADWKMHFDLFKRYGEKLGLLFQITDDILDARGSVESLGKTPGKDANSDKLTYISCYGLEESIRKKNQIAKETSEIAESLKIENYSFFVELPIYVSERKN